MPGQFAKTMVLVPLRNTRCVMCHPTARPSTRLATLADEILGAILVADRFGRLMDDRPFVKIGGDVMGGRADHLDPAGMGLMVWLGPLEAGQEGMVDVDATARKERGKIV